MNLGADRGVDQNELGGDIDNQLAQADADGTIVDRPVDQNELGGMLFTVERDTVMVSPNKSVTKFL